MTGKSHVIMNIASAVAIADTWFLASHYEKSPEWLVTISDKAADLILKQDMMPMWLFLGISVFLYLLGALLPDMDLDTSAIGRIIYLPVGHRTWTHALYLPIIFGVIGVLWFKPLLWLAIGYFLHLYWDSFSGKRIRYFYPGKWEFGISFYHTAQMSEYVFLCINCGVVIAYTVLVCQLVFRFMEVSLAL